jgi:ketosteroid isomerase-like protein
MQDAWNRGDLEQFLSAYWDSPELTFFSNGRRLVGRTTLASNLRQRYEQDMGRITFGDPHFGLAGSDFAVIWGDWRLELENGVTRHGVGTAVFRYIDGQWRIVHDHTSFVDSSANRP